MKVNRFKELLGEEGLTEPEIMSLLEGKSDSDELRLADLNDHFAGKLWTRSDVAGMIREMGYDPSPQNIEKVIKNGGKWDCLNSCDDSGWDKIREEVSRTLGQYRCVLRHPSGQVPYKGSGLMASKDGCIMWAAKNMGHGDSCEVFCGNHACMPPLTRDGVLRVVWRMMGDAPFFDGYLEEDWFIFKRGSLREEIWDWFDKNHSKGVDGLLHGKGTETAVA